MKEHGKKEHRNFDSVLLQFRAKEYYFLILAHTD